MYVHEFFMKIRKEFFAKYCIGKLVGIGHPGKLVGHPGKLVGHPGKLVGHPGKYVSRASGKLIEHTCTGKLVGHPGKLVGHVPHRPYCGYATESE